MGCKRKSVFYDEIHAILGCRDIVTLDNVCEAGTANSSDGERSAVSSEFDGQSNSRNKTFIEEERKSMGKEKKKSRKRSRLDVEEEEDEERKEFREILDSFKECGQKLSNFMETFREGQQQQTAMMGQFVGAMTHTNSEKSLTEITRSIVPVKYSVIMTQFNHALAVLTA